MHRTFFQWTFSDDGSFDTLKIRAAVSTKSTCIPSRRFSLAMAVTDAAEGFTAEEQALFEKLNIGKEGGVPLPRFIKPSDVTAQAKPLAESIFEDWNHLSRLVSRNEEALYERWKNLKKKKRRDLLIEEWNEMASPHRPDLAIWRKREKPAGSPIASWTEKDREAFMWPHINLEDLSKNRPLWLLLKARARNPPDTFAASDLDTTRFGKGCLALTPRYLNKFSMVFTGRSTPDTYGQLYAWDDVSPEEKLVIEQSGTHPGEGLWILTIQARLYRFLKNIAIAVLGQSAADGENGPAAPELPNSHGMPDAEFGDLPLAMSEAPYTSRGPLRLQTLLDFTCARLWGAEDHLWALRQDPAYFTDSIRQWREHQWEMIPRAGKTASESVRESASAIWSRAINSCVRQSLEQIETWNILYAKVHLVTQQMEKHLAAVKPTTALPQELALAFYSFCQHIKNFESEHLENLRLGVYASPPLRRHFRAEPVKDGNGASEPTITPAGGDNLDSNTSEIIWALEKLQNTHQRELLGTASILDHLEHIMSTDATARDCLSPWTASQISTLGIFTLCHAEIERFQPWESHFAREMQDSEIREVLGMDWHMSTARLRPLHSHELSDKATSLGNPDDGKFDSSGGRAALDTFWNKVVTSLEKGKALTPRVKDVLSQIAASESRGNQARIQPIRSKAKIKVDKRSLRTFRALFHDPTTDTAKSSMPAGLTWLDFVHAMHSAGFTITRMYASGWLFVPGRGKSAGVQIQAQRPSLFYEPWGEAKVPGDMARVMGKRLGRAYGWTTDTFEAE